MSDQEPKRHGFVVGGKPGDELQQLRKLLEKPAAERDAGLEAWSRQAKTRAKEFAEREVAAILNDRR